MRIAMPVWENHVSTVLDFSETLLIVDISDREIKAEDRIDWSLCNDTMKLSLMQDQGVAVLLCGAVSKPLQIMLESSGIKLIHGLRGHKDALLKAYLDGELHEEHFRLPGAEIMECSGRKKRCLRNEVKSRGTRDRFRGKSGSIENNNIEKETS